MSRNLNKKDFSARNALINKYLCNFITKKWLLDFKHEGKTVTHNVYAKHCGLSSSTITKIKEESGYNIPLSTIYSICQKEKVVLSDFFKEFEKEYGIDIMS